MVFLFMKYTFNIIDWYARAPALSQHSDWQHWAHSNAIIDNDAAQAKLTLLPAMTARRLKSGSRLAVECALMLLQHYKADALLFTSRHGELERNLNILQALAAEQAISPTDFALSVHNAAAGNLTIVCKQPLVCSALSAGVDTFQQGLYEVLSLMQGGYQRVLMVDFDGDIPLFYQPLLAESLQPNQLLRAYALALLLEAGEKSPQEGDILPDVAHRLCCTPVSHPVLPSATAVAETLPQSLQFLRGWLTGQPDFTVTGARQNWLWTPLCQ